MTAENMDVLWRYVGDSAIGQALVEWAKPYYFMTKVEDKDILSRYVFVLSPVALLAFFRSIQVRFKKISQQPTPTESNRRWH